MDSNYLRKIQGDGGQISQGWRAGPSKVAAQAAADEATFTSSSGTFARVSNAKKGTRRREAMRSRFELSQVVQAGFGLGPIAVTQRVISCYCASARGE